MMNVKRFRFVAGLACLAASSFWVQSTLRHVVPNDKISAAILFAPFAILLLCGFLLIRGRIELAVTERPRAVVLGVLWLMRVCGAAAILAGVAFILAAWNQRAVALVAEGIGTIAFGAFGVSVHAPTLDRSH